MTISLTAAETAILGLICERPLHGYELNAVIEQRGLREWTAIGFSSIYFLLQKLETKGLVQQASPAERPKSKKLFSATVEGARVLRRQALSMIASPKPVFPDLLVGLANWPALAPGDGLAALSSRRLSVEAELVRIEDARTAVARAPAFVDSIFDYALGALRAELSWICRTETRLGADDGQD